GAPEFRYAYHEVIEEGQHSLMFQEFVNRTGLRVHGLSPWMVASARRVVTLGRRFPELFFLFVLGAVAPVDYVQREIIKTDRNVHPLLKRIIQIHVTEEARHLCFARFYLKENVKHLGPLRRLRLAIGAPIILGNMAKIMMQPSRAIIRKY